jgi:hypothetical protein
MVEIMNWKVNLEVHAESDAQPTQIHSFSIEAKSVAMALEKAVQQARRIGWQTVGVCSCNPSVELPRINYGWAGSGSQIA